MMRGQYLSKNAQQLNKGLVIYHSFDFARSSGATAFDDSGIGGDATLSTGYAFSTGKIGDAISTTSSAHLAEKNSATAGQSKNVSAITICAWLSKSAFSSVRDRIYSEIGPSATRLTFYVKSGGIIGLGFRIADSDSFTTVETGSSIFGLNTFHHIAGVLNISGDNVDIFYNGAVQSTSGTKTFTPTAFSNTDSTQIQLGKTDDTSTFIGYLDSVRKYNRALTNAEILAIYNMV